MWLLVALSLSIPIPPANVAQQEAPEGTVRVANLADWLAVNPNLALPPPEGSVEDAHAWLEANKVKPGDVTAAWVEQKMGWQAVKVTQTGWGKANIEGINDITGHKCAGTISYDRYGNGRHSYKDLENGRRFGGQWGDPGWSPGERARRNAGLAVARQMWPHETSFSEYNGIWVPEHWIANIDERGRIVGDYLMPRPK